MRKLTLKQQEFCKKFVETRNGTEAAMQSYSCKSREVAKNVAVINNRKPQIRAEIERLLQEQHLTEDLVFSRLKDGLDAKSTSAFEGQVMQSDVPDMPTRLGYIKEAAKIMDLYPPQRTESRSVNLDLQLENMNPKDLATLLKELAQQIYGQPDNQEKLGTGVSDTETPEKAKG